MISASTDSAASSCASDGRQRSQAGRRLARASAGTLPIDSLAALRTISGVTRREPCA